MPELLAREIFAHRMDSDEHLIPLAQHYGDPLPERWMPAHVEEQIAMLTLIEGAREAWVKLAASVQ